MPETEKLDFGHTGEGITSGGATANILRTVRTMTPYHVYESELQHISYLNTIMSIAVGLSGFFASATLSLSLALAQTSNLEPVAKRLLFYGIVATGVLMAACFLVAGISWYARRQQWNQIKSETRIIQSASGTERSQP